MGRYLLRRLASAVVTLWILATIVFLMVNVIPGNVGRSVLGPFALKEDVARYNHQIGTDRPLIRQYITSLRRLFTLDFGHSYQSGTLVDKIIFPALFRSGKLALLAFVFTIPISIAAGIFTPRRQDKVADRVVVNVGLAPSSIPQFVPAALLMSPFCLHWKVVHGYGTQPDCTSG